MKSLPLIGLIVAVVLTVLAGHYGLLEPRRGDPDGLGVPAAIMVTVLVFAAFRRKKAHKEVDAKERRQQESRRRNDEIAANLAIMEADPEIRRALAARGCR